MRRETINYTMVGGFIVAMLVCLMVVAYLIVGRAGPNDLYYVHYGFVSGLKYGTPVYYEGYQVGQVEEIEPVRKDNSLRYRVDFSITKGWPIPSDSIARMMSTGLLSTVSININEGDSKELLAPGAEIIGQEGGDVLRVINEVALDLSNLANQSLRPLLDNLNRQVSRISDRVEKEGGEVWGDLSQMMKRLDQSAEAFQEFLSEENRRDLRSVVENAKVASESVVKISGLAEAATNGAVQLMEEVRETRAHLDKLVVDLDQTVTDNQDDLSASVRSLRHSLDVVSERVDQMAHHMEGTSRNLHEFSRQIRENPGSLLSNSPPAETAEQP